MSDVEQRLRNALDARAALVQPEGLSLSPVLEPPREEPTRWWQRPGSSLLVAAVAVIVIALPLLVLAATGGDDRDPDGDVANSPTGNQTMTDPVPSVPDETGGDPTGQVGPDRWWEEPVDGLPTSWDVEGTYAGSFATDVDGDGTPGDSVSVDQGELVVDTGEDTGEEESRIAVDGPSPRIEGVVRLSGSATPVVLLHTTEGAAGTTYVSWQAFAFVDGTLVRLTTVPLAPSFTSQYSNLSPEEGGHPLVRTWLTGDDALHGMDYLERARVEGPGGETVWAYLVRVRSWYVDGATLRATTLGRGCVAPAVGMQISECPDGL